jgi:hypothetical protein
MPNSISLTHTSFQYVRSNKTLLILLNSTFHHWVSLFTFSKRIICVHMCMHVHMCMYTETSFYSPKAIHVFKKVFLKDLLVPGTEPVREKWEFKQYHPVLESFSGQGRQTEIKQIHESVCFHTVKMLLLGKVIRSASLGMVFLGKLKTSCYKKFLYIGFWLNIYKDNTTLYW